MARLSVRQRVAAATIVALVVIGIAVAAVLWHHSPPSSLPVTIRKQISFATYFPTESWNIQASETSYQNGVLRFSAQQSNKQLVFTEQAAPPVFTEVPQYLPTLLTKMNQYSSFNSPLGAVYLTKPTELKGGQTAVVEDAGTLLFVRPNQNLSDDEWRRLFSDMH